MAMPAKRTHVGLVLTGGGARAAYQVGVLRAVAAMVPNGAPSPFDVLCGTSAGAINAAALAANATDFRLGVRRLVDVWKNMHAGHVYRADLIGIAACSARWLASLVLGAIGSRIPVSLLDNSPLQAMLAKHLDLPAIQRAIDSGALRAVAVTASGYTSGESISFFQAGAALEGWRRSRRAGVKTALDVGHLMASSALPFVFPPVRIHREFFGDGSMRQIAPISPALHLGADRVLVVTVAATGQIPTPRIVTERPPSLAQIAGHALNSIFLDALEADLERLERINRTIALLNAAAGGVAHLVLKHVDCLVISPSEPLEQIALRHVRALPRTVRFFLRGIGATRRSGSNLASYVLFERPFCRALMRLGYRDAMGRREEIVAFLRAGSAPPVPHRLPTATAANDSHGAQALR
jgi:NTE family protein